jgi:Excalibur calcium-binding domain
MSMRSLAGMALMAAGFAGYSVFGQPPDVSTDFIPSVSITPNTFAGRVNTPPDFDTIARLAPGIDRDCRDFSTHAQAQAFFQSQGPGDPHRLDRDGDGMACETLP